MPKTSYDFISGVLDGSDRRWQGRLVRGVTAVAEPFYAAVMWGRNSFYSRGILGSHSLGRPTVSIGNITTGGTGKTPVVGWLADRLRGAGRQPAVLLRGYKAAAGGISDEQQVLDRALNSAAARNIPVRANPSRVESGAELLQEQPDVDVFVLDDAFQHRKVLRDFNLVLISATDPFGFGHVLPRGLLREPMSGLRRADAFLITRCSQVGKSALKQIRDRLSRYQPAAPIYCSDHVHTSVRSGETGERLPIESLRGEKFYAFCGIANPASFELQLRSIGGELVGHQWFADHHPYNDGEMRDIQKRAMAAGARKILTTEKDWVKIAGLGGKLCADPAIGVIELSIGFYGDDEERLFAQIVGLIAGMKTN